MKKVQRRSLVGATRPNFKAPKLIKTSDNGSTTMLKVRRPELKGLSSFDIANYSLKAIMELTMSESFFEKYYHNLNANTENIVDDVKDSLITHKDLIAEALVEEGAPDVADHLGVYIHKYARYLQRNPTELYQICEEFLKMSKTMTLVHTQIKVEKNVEL